VDTLEAIGVMLIGLAVRFVIPIVLTILIVMWLRRLDARWQLEANQTRPRGAVVPMPQVRCWEQRGCPPERQASCPAYGRPDMPCWQVFRGANGRLQEACLDCDIFKNALAPMNA
jgi:hypothetical protein